MRKIKLLLAGIAIATTVISCGNKSETKDGASTEEAAASSNGLDGTWEIVKAEGTMADLNKGTQYIFEGDKLTLKGGGIKTPGTFKLAGDTILFAIDGSTMEMKYTYAMVNNQLVAKVVGSDQVFYMDKK